MKKTVSFNNELNNVALVGFNATEIDFLMAICSKMRDKKNEKIEFEFEELKNLIKYKKKNNKKFVEDLHSMNIKLMNLKCSFISAKRIISFVLFPTFDIDVDNKKLFVRVNEDLLFLLNNLGGNFTQFELDNIISLKSKYSKLLYKQLIQFKKSGFRIFKLEDFKLQLDIPDKYRISDIDKRILIPSKEEFNNLFYDYCIEKKYENDSGRKVSHLEFRFKEKKNKHDGITKEQEIITKSDEIITKEQEIITFFKANFKEINLSKEVQNTLFSMLKKDSLTNVKNYLLEVWGDIKTLKNINNPAGFFVNCILEKKRVKCKENIEEKQENPKEDEYSLLKEIEEITRGSEYLTKLLKLTIKNYKTIDELKKLKRELILIKEEMEKD